MKMFLSVQFALIAALLTGVLQAQTEIEVDRDMLLWKKGFAYQTQVDTSISLTNTKIEVDLQDRKAATGGQDRSFHYLGSMLYSTEIDKPTNYNGSAKRYYHRCTVSKIETSPLQLKIPATVGEIWASRAKEWVGMESLPPDWRPHVSVVERNAEVNGTSYIIVRQKADSPNPIVRDALDLGFQSMVELTGKWIFLEWSRTEAIKKAKVQVGPLESRQGQQVKSGGFVSPIVREVIGRESKLLFEAMLGSVDSRQDGEMWVVEGKTLDAMVHPTVEGNFNGSAVVQAVSIKNESPERTVGEMNGFKLKFIPGGDVEGRYRHTDLRLVFGTVDGGTHETRLVPEDGAFSGEIWLDTENQTVRYGNLKVDRAKYDGFLPKIGKLSAKVKLKGDLNFELVYIQSISASEE